MSTEEEHLDDERGNLMKKKLIVWLVVIISVVGVIFGGKRMIDKQNLRIDIEKQRTAASSVKEVLSGLEEIKFYEAGGHVNGAGTWHAGAEVKINEKWYVIDTVENGVAMMKSGFPQQNMHGGTKGEIKVIFSDSEEEILK
ncbi:MAG: hypothetical protein LBI13_01590 [Streptococcaceae bacterium]|jgi:hypothetical protein|nr:hypothetical protein [Streptococcaceae bacterium]